MIWDFRDFCWEYLYIYAFPVIIFLLALFLPLLLLQFGRNLKIENEWWLNCKNSNYYRLVIPPYCVFNGENHNTLNVVKESKKFVRNIYNVASGGKKYKRKKVGWILDATKLPSDCIPLVCFVNTNSGGRQGTYIIKELKNFLNPIQIIDLSKNDPEIIMQTFSFILKTKWRILICGGDGTIGWIFNTMYILANNKNIDFKCPPVAILPIGTGNDLAIELGWNINYINSDSIVKILESILQAQILYLDRWEIETFDYVENNDVNKKVNLNNKTMKAKDILSKNENDNQNTSTATTTTIKKKENNNIITNKKYFQNYCGLGVDAQIVLQFHLMRNNKPHRFFNRFINKLWYIFIFILFNVLYKFFL
jgi:diacylglycerol kinase family enzyme